MIKQLYKEQDKNNKKNNQDPPDYNGDGNGNALVPVNPIAFPTEYQWNNLSQTLPRLKTDGLYTRNYLQEYSPRSMKTKAIVYMADNESIIPREDVTLPYPNLPPKEATLPYPTLTTRNLPMLPVSQTAEQYARSPIVSKIRQDIRNTQSEINTICALGNNTGIRPVIDVKINGRSINALCDTGATVYILRQTFLKPNELNQLSIPTKI